MNRVRLAWAILCLLFALLIPFPAQTYTLWQLSVLATEFSSWLVLAALLALLPGWRRSRSGRIAAALAFAALLLGLYPIARAWATARAGQRELTRAYGRAGTLFNPVRLFTPGAGETVVPRTVTYAPALQLDLYPTTNRRGPLVLVVHGGSWRAGDRLQLPALNHVLARHGYAVASIDYRLAPAHPYPAAVDDIRTAIEYLKRNAPALGITADRIVLLGRSAGGHLALLAAHGFQDPALRGVISYYGPTDLRWSWNHPSNPRVINSHEVLSQFMGGTLTQRASAYDAASPLRYVQQDVPTLLLHGSRDELVSVQQSRRMMDALGRNPRAVFIELPWATHGCDYSLNGPCGQVTTGAVLQFLRWIAER